MIGVKLQGRLGNQLFQYAFAFAAAKKANTKFYLDKRLSHEVISQYFLTSHDSVNLLDKTLFAIKGFNGFFTSFLRLGFYSKLQRMLRLQTMEFSNDTMPAEEMQRIKNQCLYEGYFQSEQYFEEYKTDIKSEFEIRGIFSTQFKKIFNSLPIGFKYVVVHIRKTDYITHNFDLPMSYFHGAIASIHNPNNFYIVISDDIDLVSKEFGYLSNLYFSRNTEIIDFQFLKNADICILSNSSFSWWGAYLNSGNPQVIAPKHWLGYRTKKEHPLQAMPLNWIKFES